MSDASARPAVPLEYDPTSWEIQEDPYPSYRRLRDEAPVYHNERMGFWALSRFQDVWDATLDWESFTSIHGQTLEKVSVPLPIMISMDPPQHTRVRALVAKAFTPRRVAEMEPIVRRLTRERFADLEPGMQIDLFEQLASSMPMDVISTMLGVPPVHRDRVRHLTNEMMHREPGELEIVCPLLQDDPPHYDRLRRILSKAFTPKITAQREHRVREIADELVADLRRRLAEGGDVDLVRAFTSPLPVNVIAEILGIPPELKDRLRMWNATTSVTGAVELAEAHRPETMREMHETLAELLEKRRSDRRNDLFSALIEASENDESPLRPDELVGLCQLLWNAGNETTTNLLSNIAVVLQQRPDLLEMAGKQPQTIPAMVDEFLRLHTPINCLARTATEDLEFQGQKIRKDDVLMVIFAAANRDPRHFERADEFDPDRRPNDHVAFSHGIHFCLGSHLARLEARVGLEVLGELLPHVRIRADRGVRIPTGLLRGWLTLPLAPA